MNKETKTNLAHTSWNCKYIVHQLSWWIFIIFSALLIKSKLFALAFNDFDCCNSKHCIVT